jgi:hypothetical protein
MHVSTKPQRQALSGEGRLLLDLPGVDGLCSQELQRFHYPLEAQVSKILRCEDANESTTNPDTDLQGINRSQFLRISILFSFDVMFGINFSSSGLR